MPAGSPADDSGDQRGSTSNPNPLSEGSQAPAHEGVQALWLNKLDPSKTLENSGSVARDHLANERTWLAYLRTSLALASAGVALVQLFTISAKTSNDNNSQDGSHLQRFARPLGAATVCIGIIVLGIGAQRYFRVQHALTKGRFPPARISMGIISSLLVTTVAVTFGVLLGVRR
ncbi:uncharacterized protein EI90DRAFT_3049860 [Cantharellus anzutake]|uniref:uncharacterized protein n=1 Tax=Cantharellus anzutake TaxID=1750568 RepID=UPI001908DF56|nr:uncharacterized protein EI90DRAFT_3049860 [Cantharellus anzutake]KAF8334689.1 hypothetical protein EI90DRAFT_3049860 [Cantharellus anzutake]